MNRKTNLALVAMLSLAGSLPLTSPVFADDHDEVRKLMQQGDILPLETILDKAQARHAGRAVETRLEEKHGKLVYEVEILDDKGEVWEMKFDARTGTLLKEEQED